MQARHATTDDAPAIARIYNEGMEDRIATFETRPRSAEDIVKWFDGVHPVVVVERGARVVAFAATSTYRPRECYAGVAEFSVYVARDERGGRGKRYVEGQTSMASSRWTFTSGRGHQRPKPRLERASSLRSKSVPHAPWVSLAPYP